LRRSSCSSRVCHWRTASTIPVDVRGAHGRPLHIVRLPSLAQTSASDRLRPTGRVHNPERGRTSSHLTSDAEKHHRAARSTQLLGARPCRRSRRILLVVEVLRTGPGGMNLGSSFPSRRKYVRGCTRPPAVLLITSPFCPCPAGYHNRFACSTTFGSWTPCCSSRSRDPLV